MASNRGINIFGVHRQENTKFPRVQTVGTAAASSPVEPARRTDSERLSRPRQLFTMHIVRR